MSKLNRRKFIGSAATAIVVPNIIFGNQSNSSEIANKLFFLEKARKLEIKDEVDVIVCGGGPAGIAAAITAARAGASVRVFEVNGCLGGVWTSGLLTWIFEFDKPGLPQEILFRLDDRNARRGTDRDNFVYEPDEMKLLLEDMFVESGIKFLLKTRVVA